MYTPSLSLSLSLSLSFARLCNFNLQQGRLENNVFISARMVSEWVGDVV